MSKITNNNDIIQELIDILQNKATSGGIDTSDATATAEDILVDKTAYVAGIKITGTYEPLDTTDATATAQDLALNKTAYVNGKKITGTYEPPIDVGTALITNTLSNYTNSTLTYARSYAFAGMSLTNLTLPKLTSYGYSAFHGTQIETLTLNALYRLDRHIGTARIGTLIAPNLGVVSNEYYWGGTYIQNFCWSNPTKLYSYAVFGASVQNLELPNVSIIEQSGWDYGYAGKVSFPKLRDIRKSAFKWGAISGKFCLNAFPTMSSSAFYGTYLRYFSIQDSTFNNFTIPTYCFYSTGLQALILNCPGVVQLETSLAFVGTAMTQSSLSWVGSAARSPGTIYVPSSLVDVYRSATNWNYYSQKIQAIPPDNKRLYIDGKFYECDEGMTWAEWTASAYNTDGYVNMEWAIGTPDEEWLIGTYLYDSYVNSEDIIDLDLAYTWTL